MKRIIIILSLIFSCNAYGDKDLCHDKDYWIEEINKINALYDGSNKFNNCFLFGIARVPLMQLEPSLDDIKQSMKTVSKVLSDNSANAKEISVDFYSNSLGVRELRTKYILDALVTNKTATKLVLKRMGSTEAKPLARIIANNNKIFELECEESSFTDKDIGIISEALEQNHTLQSFKFTRSNLSMKSRKRILAAWSNKGVSGRKKEIEF